MKHIFTTAVFLIFAASIGDFQEIQAEKNELKTRIYVPRKTITVEVANPSRLKLILKADEKSGFAKLREFEGQQNFAFEVPHGKYFLHVPDTGKQFAVPAIQTQAKSEPIRVRITEYENEKGWAWIPAGPSIIGDSLGIGAEDERPVRVIDIPGFWMGMHEVTNSQYSEFLSAQDDFDSAWIDLHSRKCLIEKTENGFEPNVAANSLAATLPVVMVSHEGASEYCKWLTRQTGIVHRLPVETEWEKAARGPLQQVYAYGDTYCQSSANQESGELLPVGSFRPNGYRLYDMTGNVFEWMGNRYDPSKGTSVMNQALRGGSFVLDGMYLRNSFRMRQSPDVMTDDIGFRVLREAKSIADVAVN